MRPRRLRFVWVTLSALSFINEKGKPVVIAIEWLRHATYKELDEIAEK